MKANGGLELLKVIQAVRLAGKIESAGVVCPFFTMRKRPDRMLMIFDFETHELTCAVDGDVVWQRVRVPGQEPQVQVLDGAQAESFLSMRAFFYRPHEEAVFYG